MREARVPTATSRMSRSKCSTPISSASSASMMDGVWTKVLDVAVPSWVCLSALYFSIVGMRIERK